MKKIFIHAGPGKTGTSAVQNWLNKNRAYLSEHGIFYPEHRLDDNGVSSGNLNEILSLSEDNKWFVDRDKLSKLIDNFNFSDYQTLLLSSEFFFNHIEELNVLIPNAEFIVYFRDPISLLESGYNQSIKRHGKTELFKIDENNFSSFFIERLVDVFNNCPDISINIRPYHREFFKNNNVVSDIMFIVNPLIDIKLKESIINPSYTLPALEFKRYLNYFPIQELQPEIDRVLQSYDKGLIDYTFVPDKTFIKIMEITSRQLKSFVLRDNDNFSSLKIFFDHISNVDNNKRIYSPQIADENQLIDVVEYIKLKNEKLYENLVSIIYRNKNLILPVDFFHSCFGLIETDEKFDFISSDLEKVLSKKYAHNADLFREIALFMEADNKIEYAEVFMELAHLVRPKGPYIKMKLNEYRITRNNKVVEKVGKKNWLSFLNLKKLNND